MYRRLRSEEWVWQRLPSMVLSLTLWANAGGLLRGQDPTDETPRQSAALGAKAVALLEDAVRYELDAKQLPAFSIALYDGRQRTTWSAGFGSCDEARKRSASAASIYRVGSVSKLLTDLAIMKLVEQGQLDLDLPVQTWIPEFRPENAFDQPITLRYLMSHRAGLVRESPVGNYFDDSEPSLAATVHSMNSTSLVFAPGERTKYSNAGIAVVGYVIEKSQGVPFSQWMKQHVLDPIGMTSSSFVRTDDVAARQALGWMWTYDGRRFAAPDFALGTLPAGNLYASVIDLQKLMAMILDKGHVGQEQIVSAATLERMMSPEMDGQGRPFTFGIGFHVDSFDGHRSIGHGGAVYGYSTQFQVLVDQQLGVAAVAGLDGSNGVVQRLSDYALRLALAEREERPLPDYQRSQPIPRERHAELSGRYAQVDGDGEIEIWKAPQDVRLREGTFQRQLRDQSNQVIIDDLFGLGPHLTRQPNGDLEMNARRFARQPNEPPTAVPDRWAGLIGEYGWDHNTLYILEDRGQLYALIEWFYYYPLSEISADRFAFPDFGMYHDEYLEFQRDADGLATQVLAAGIRFPRRETGTRNGQTFRIEPLRPVDELRTIALQSAPPQEVGQFRDPELVDVTDLDATIQLDVRYATTNNFMGARFYQQPRALLQRPAAEALVRVHQRLRSEGYGLLIHDAYRPWHVTKMFWDATPNHLKDFVADPAQGSRHNRGCAVDLTLYDLQTGKAVPMVAGYDEFSVRSFPEYPGGTARQRWHRQQLREAMEAEGFTIYQYEWWHFDYQDWEQYPIQNKTFEEIVGEESQ